MRIGNVIKSPGGQLWIVTSVDDKVVRAVSFDSENCTATMRLDDHMRTEPCLSCLEGGVDPDCETCKGNCSYERKIEGWKRSEVLATTVMAFINQGVKRLLGV